MKKKFFLSIQAYSALFLSILCQGAIAQSVDQNDAPISQESARLAEGESCRPTWPLPRGLKQKAGVVEVLLLVSEDGIVKGARLLTSSGNPDLDRSTVIAYRNCRFVPAVKNGINVVSWFPLKHEWIAGKGLVNPMGIFEQCDKPEWPKAELALGHQGAVVLSFLIDANGSRIESKVTKSSGYPVLDTAAQTGLDKCKFAAGTEDGKPVTEWMTMQYVWTIDGDITR